MLQGDVIRFVANCSCNLQLGTCKERDFRIRCMKSHCFDWSATCFSRHKSKNRPCIKTRLPPPPPPPPAVNQLAAMDKVVVISALLYVCSLREITGISNTRTLRHSFRTPRNRIRHIKVIHRHLENVSFSTLHAFPYNRASPRNTISLLHTTHVL